MMDVQALTDDQIWTLHDLIDLGISGYDEQTIYRIEEELERRMFVGAGWDVTKSFANRTMSWEK